MADLTTWTTVQNRLELDSSVQEKAEKLIALASTRADRHTRRTLGATDHVDILSGTGGLTLQLKNYPVQSITDVRADSSDVFGEDSILTEYTADNAVGQLYRRSGWPEGWRNIRVEYRAGYEIESIPEDLEESIVQLVGYWLNSPSIAFMTPQEDAVSGGYQTNYVGVLDVPYVIRIIWDGYKEIAV